MKQYQWALAIALVALGALLYAYASAKGVTLPERTDHLFPMLALQHLGTFAAVVFILGLTAATFSSADSVLTTLTLCAALDSRGCTSTNTATLSPAYSVTY